MTKEVREAFRIHFKWTVLEYARGIGNVTEACREFNVPRSTFYEWKKAFDKAGSAVSYTCRPVQLLFYFWPSLCCGHGNRYVASAIFSV